MDSEDDKISEFEVDGKLVPVDYVDTQEVKEGVVCSVYDIIGDSTKDLAIIHVAKGHKTPLQRVIKGERTVQGFISGEGILEVTSEDGSCSTYQYPGEPKREVIVGIGQLMQWSATGGSISFYEVCVPPYEDGRFENL